MKVLVTGGAGYIGTELARALADNDQVEEVILYDNLSRINYNLFLGRKMQNGHKLRFVHAELLDSRSLKKYLQGVDVVYHLAAVVTTPFANVDSHFLEQTNHWGTSELVSAIEDSDVKKVIYTSSTSVYGASSGYITEESHPNPKTVYGISKNRGESHFDRLKDKIHTYVLRCGNVYGYSKSMRFDSVINKFMFEANFSNRISIDGNGKQWRAFIHVDVLSKVLNDFATKNPPSGTYNVVDKNLQVLDLVDALKEIYPPLEFIFISQHLTLREMKVDPASKLRDYISYKNERSLKEELLEFKERFSF